MTEPAPTPSGVGRTADPSPRIVFVGGLHRSGTSLVHRCLAAHPQAAGFHDTGVPEDEGQHLQSVYPRAYAYGGAGLFGFDPAAHLTEASPLVTDANRAQLLEEWGRHWEPGVPVVVEKSPPNLIRARFLQALFPDAVFVMVMRHPVAVAAATRKGRRRRLTHLTLVRHWLACHATMAADAAHVANLHVVRYERFVADPDRELVRLFAAAGLDPHQSGERVRTGINDAYFKRWNSTWNPLMRWDRARTIARCEEDVNRFGYSLVDLRRVDEPAPVV